MDVFSGFHLNYWQGLGFKFTTNTPYDGLTTMRASKQLGEYEFELLISNNTAVASVKNLSTKEYERHAVSEAEAIAWFSKIPDFLLRSTK